MRREFHVRFCEGLGGKFPRATRLIILTRGRAAEGYMPSLERILGKLHLELSWEKTRVVEAEAGFEFLGVHFRLKPTRHRGTRQYCYCFPTSKAMCHVRQRVREEIGREYRKSLADTIRYLNPVLRGWSNYYNWLNSAGHFHKVDRYVVWKLGRWLRRKQQRTRRAFRRPSYEWWYGQGRYRCSGHIVRVW